MGGGGVWMEGAGWAIFCDENDVKCQSAGSKLDTVISLVNSVNNFNPTLQSFRQFRYIMQCYSQNG